MGGLRYFDEFGLVFLLYQCISLAYPESEDSFFSPSVHIHNDQVKGTQHKSMVKLSPSLSAQSKIIVFYIKTFVMGISG